MTTTAAEYSKQDITAALRRFTNSRPGLEFGNYGDVSAYRSELRSITKDRQQALTLIAAVESAGITAEELLAAFSAYAGRLSVVPSAKYGAELEYCTGQYYPTEYRRAVCAVCSQALWNYYREKCMPEPVNVADGKRYDGLSAGDFLRRCARRNLGASLAKRWFN